MNDKKRMFGFWNKGLCLGTGVLGALMISLSLASVAYAFQSANFAIQELCAHMEGSLGALLMAAAGVGAVAAAAFGNFRASFSFLITGIGAFTVSAMLSLHFPQAATTCAGGAQQGQNAGPQGNDNNAPRVINQDVFADTDPFGEP